MSNKAQTMKEIIEYLQTLEFAGAVLIEWEFFGTMEDGNGTMSIRSAIDTSSMNLTRNEDAE